MKKFLSLSLTIMMLILFSFNLASCYHSDYHDVSCDEILDAYDSAGYTISYHNHNDPVHYEFNELCNIKIEDPTDPERNYIYITRYPTVEDAEAMVKEQQFNPVLWFTFGIYGEWRWLKNGNYGDIYYATFDSKMIDPLKSLMQ